MTNAEQKADPKDWKAHPFTLLIVSSVFAIFGIIIGPWAQSVFSGKDDSPSAEVFSLMKEQLAEVRSEVTRLKDLSQTLSTENVQLKSQLIATRSEMDELTNPPEIVTLRMNETTTVTARSLKIMLAASSTDDAMIIVAGDRMLFTLGASRSVSGPAGRCTLKLLELNPRVKISARCIG